MRILFCDDDGEAMRGLRDAVLEYFRASGQAEPECVLCRSGTRGGRRARVFGR